MDEQEVQKSCWGVTTWAVVVFLGVFAVISFFGNTQESGADKIAAAEQH